MTTLGLIGSGLIGSALARLAVKAGYDVVVSNSRGPETLADLVAELGPKASAGTAQEAAQRADLAVVTVPLKAYRDAPVAPLAGKVVIDTNNYYPQRDGVFPELEDGTATSAGLLQAHLPESHVVKGFNHIQFDHLAEQGQPAGTDDRRALVIAGNDDEAKATVAEFMDAIGYDTVDIGPLTESWRIQPGTPGYGPRMTRVELKEAVAAAQRPGTPGRGTTDSPHV